MEGEITPELLVGAIAELTKKVERLEEYRVLDASALSLMMDFQSTAMQFHNKQISRATAIMRKNELVDNLAKYAVEQHKLEPEKYILISSILDVVAVKMLMNHQTKIEEEELCKTKLEKQKA